jgi:hypothetical protein
MCIDRTHSTELVGSAQSGDDRMPVRRAVVSYVHPLDIDAEHALCIDLRSDADPSEHVSIELDETSARRLAETIKAALDT